MAIPNLCTRVEKLAITCYGDVVTSDLVSE